MKDITVNINKWEKYHMLEWQDSTLQILIQCKFINSLCNLNKNTNGSLILHLIYFREISSANLFCTWLQQRGQPSESWVTRTQVGSHTHRWQRPHTEANSAASPEHTSAEAGLTTEPGLTPTHSHTGSGVLTPVPNPHS